MSYCGQPRRRLSNSLGDFLIEHHLKLLVGVCEGGFLASYHWINFMSRYMINLGLIIDVGS